MRTIRSLLPLAFLFALAGAASAQVTVTPDPPPAGAVRLRDFWNGTLVQPGPAAIAARVRVTVRSTGGELLFDARSNARDFPAGTRRINSLSLEPLTVTTVAPAIENALMRTGALPDGRYTLCLEALDPGGASLSSPACVDLEIASVLPPQPMQPANGGSTSDPFIVWTWFMQPTTAAGEAVVCDLRVVEILGEQTPEEAMRNNPPVLVRENLRSSAWQTNEAVRALHADQTYAWKLVARVGNRVASESEIWTFTYLAPEQAPVAPGAEPVPAYRAGDTPAAPAPANPPGGAPSGGGVAATPSGPSAPPPPPEAVAAAAAPEAAAPAVPAAPRPIELHAVARATMFSSNRPGTLSRGPSDYARLEIDPTLSIYGSPLALNLLLSTEQDPRQSEIERGSIGFDQGRGLALRQRIDGRTQELQRSREELLADTLRLVRDDLDRLDRELGQLEALRGQEPTQTVRELEQLGLVNANEAAALRIPAFAFGSVAPEFGRALLAGVTVNGGMVEFQPGRWHADVAAGKLSRADDGSTVLPVTPDGTRPELFQDLVSARVGVGRRNTNHLFLTGLYARDDRQSRAIVALSHPGEPTPVAENLVLGMAGSARNVRGTLRLDGDAQTALSTADRNGPALRDLPGTGALRALFGSRVREGSAVDWAGGLRGSADLAGGRTRLASGIRFVGPGYASVGVRNLRRDNLQVDGSLEQRLGTRLTFGTQWGQDRTGVVLPASGFAAVQHVASRLSGQVPHFPAFDALWGFDLQNLRPGGSPQEIRNRSHLGSLRLRQGAKLGAARGLTTLAGDVIAATSNDPTGAHRSASLQVSEMVSLPSRLGLLARASRTRTRTAIEDGPEPDVTGWEGSLTWTPAGLLSGSLGITGARSTQLAQAGGFVAAAVNLGTIGALEVSGSFNDARARAAGVASFHDRAFRVQLLSRGVR